MKNDLTYSANVLLAIDKALYEIYGLRLQDIMKHCRRGDLVNIRFMCISIYKELTKEKLSSVARVFERDRSTIYHALYTVESNLEMYANFRHDYELLENKIREKL